MDMWSTDRGVIKLTWETFLSNFLEKSWDLYFTLFSPPEMCLLPPQCWATRILKHWDHCDTQINIGEGEIDTSVSRFLTSIVDQFFEKMLSVFIKIVKPSVLKLAEIYSSTRSLQQHFKWKWTKRRFDATEKLKFLLDAVEENILSMEWKSKAKWN